MGSEEMVAIGRLIVDAIERRGDVAAQARLADEVAEICARFPVPGIARA
jgi:glycine/serine hydroxymethyltransferase